MVRLILSALLVGVMCLVGCRRTGEQPPGRPNSEAPPPAPTNRIDIPSTVRANLGITFAKVQPRHVARVVRLPGRFELLPDARREHRTALGGRVELRCAPFDAVRPGDVLYTLDSPAWRDLQEHLNDTQSQIAIAQARADSIDPLLAAHKRHHDALEAGVVIWKERLAQLQESSEQGLVTADQLAEVRATLATTQANLAEVLEREAELLARKLEIQAELAAAGERLELLLLKASTILAVPVGDLTAVDDSSTLRHPRWREITTIEVRSSVEGVVERLALSSGAWADTASLVLTTIDPQRLRFRARGLQSDLGVLSDGLPGHIAPPTGSSVGLDQTMDGMVRLGLAANPDERSIELFVVPDTLRAWARDGVTAHLEVVTRGAKSEVLAIPVAATIRDGLQTVVFRRDPANPDKVIRLEADLGLSDGRWVEILSGVREGDEVVLDGIYQLMLATSGSVQKGGHFHPDGTWHEGDE